MSSSAGYHNPDVILNVPQGKAPHNNQVKFDISYVPYGSAPGIRLLLNHLFSYLLFATESNELLDSHDKRSRQ